MQSFWYTNRNYRVFFRLSDMLYGQAMDQNGCASDETLRGTVLGERRAGRTRVRSNILLLSGF